MSAHYVLAGMPAASVRGGTSKPAATTAAGDDDGILSDDRAVGHDCCDANQCIALDDAAMRHGAMADMPVLLDDHGAARTSGRPRNCLENCCRTS